MVKRVHAEHWADADDAPASSSGEGEAIPKQTPPSLPTSTSSSHPPPSSSSSSSSSSPPTTTSHNVIRHATSDISPEEPLRAQPAPERTALGARLVGGAAAAEAISARANEISKQKKKTAVAKKKKTEAPTSSASGAGGAVSADESSPTQPDSSGSVAEVFGEVRPLLFYIINSYCICLSCLSPPPSPQPPTLKGLSSIDLVKSAAPTLLDLEQRLLDCGLLCLLCSCTAA